MKGISTPHPVGRHALLLSGVVVATALAVSGCSGGTPSSSGGSPRAGGASSSPSAVAFSSCMRAGGVRNFPDPDASGRPLQVDAAKLGVSDSVYQVAETACRHLLPTSGSLAQLTHQCLLYGACPRSLVDQLLTLGRRYAVCLRSHGVPNWPDPSISAKGGRPVYDVTAAGIDPRSTGSAQFRSKDRECRGFTGGSLPRLPTS